MSNTNLGKALTQTKTIARTFRGIIMVVEALEELGDLESSLAEVRASLASVQKSISVAISQRDNVHRQIVENKEAMRRAENALGIATDQKITVLAEKEAAEKQFDAAFKTLRKNAEAEAEANLKDIQLAAENELNATKASITKGRQRHLEAMTCYELEEAEASAKVETLRNRFNELVEELNHE